MTIKGVGETYSGIYYVTHVTHVFTADGYTQRFSVKRNALHADRRGELHRRWRRAAGRSPLRTRS